MKQERGAKASEIGSATDVALKSYPAVSSLVPACCHRCQPWPRKTLFDDPTLLLVGPLTADGGDPCQRYQND
jgi:hypothetical protein